MDNMKAYIGTKVIKAEPMKAGEFWKSANKYPDDASDENTDGYMVEYPDGYKSWSPKKTFEDAYREVSQAEIELIGSTIPGESESI